MGKNLVYVAGGIGLIPLRSSIVHALQHKKEFGRVLVLHGARTPDDLMYKENLKEWQSFEGFETYITVDVPPRTGKVKRALSIPSSTRRTFRRQHRRLRVRPAGMFNTVIGELMKRGLSDENIYSTLERHMKRRGKVPALRRGKNARCTDGPVYTYRQIKTLGEEI